MLSPVSIALGNSVQVFLRAAAATPAVTSELSGLNVVLTGSFPTLGRTAASEAAVRMGAHVQSSVSAKTDLLIAGEAAGSKLAKAQSLGIRVLDAVDFEAQVAEAGL